MNSKSAMIAYCVKKNKSNDRAVLVLSENLSFVPIL